MHRTSHLVVLSAVLLAAAPAHAAIRPTWPIEFAVERADVIVVAKRGSTKDTDPTVRVLKVLHGPVREGDWLIVRGLNGYGTQGHTREAFGKEGFELQDRPLLLCLSRKSLDAKSPPETYELQTTGHGTAIKVLDHHNVYGYYQWLNPGPYYLTLERSSKDALFKRIERALDVTPRWKKITEIKDDTERADAMVAFLMDRTLPSHFVWEASYALSSSRLIAVIRDELKDTKPVPKKPAVDGPDPEALARLIARMEEPGVPDRDGWSRLSAALMWVEDDGKELLPLLEKIKANLPDYYRAAVACAARKCGSAALGFLREAMRDIQTLDDAVDGLVRLDIPQSRAAVEDGFRERIKEVGGVSWSATNSYAGKWPMAWRDFAAKLDTDFAGNPKVRAYLDESWKALVRVDKVSVNLLPPRYTEKFTAIIDRLGGPDFTQREKAAADLRMLIRDSDIGAIVRGLLRKATTEAEPAEVRRRAELILRGE